MSTGRRPFRSSPTETRIVQRPHVEQAPPPASEQEVPLIREPEAALVSPLVASRGTFRPMLRLALPVVAEQVLHITVMLTDVWLTGQFLKEAAPLAAIGLMAYAMWFAISTFEFVAMGATALVARFIGAGDRQRARVVANQAFVVGSGLAVVVTALGLYGAETYVGVMELRGEAAELAVQYLWIVLPMMPLVMIQRVGIACLRGAGDMLTVFWVMAVVNAVNVGVSCGLVMGLGPLPSLGWKGIALGTAAAYATGGLLVLAVFIVGKSGLGLSLRGLVPNPEVIRRVLRIGVPGGADMLMIICCHMWFLRIINQLGNVAAAAHGITVRIESLAFLPGAGFAMAATTLAGQLLGARQPHRAARSVWMACLTGGGVMTAMGVVFFIAGPQLVGLFVDPTGGDAGEIVGTAAYLLKIVAFAMIPLALLMILNGALRGAGDTRWPLVINLLGFLGIRIPLAYLLAWYLEWGVAGAWWALLVDCFVRCGMVLYRFFHGGWKRIEV